MKKFKIINILLISIAALFGTLNAKESLCSPRGECYAYEEFDIESKIFLMGNIHDEAGSEFEVQLMQAALEKKIVYVQESLVNTMAMKTFIAKKLGYKSAGYLFGMEDPLVNLFCNLAHDYSLLYYSIMDKPDDVDILKAWQQRVDGKKGELIANLKIDAKTKALWKEFIKSTDIQNLDKKIVSAIDTLVNLKGANTNAALARVHRELDKSPNQWIQLFKYFGLYVLDYHIAKLPENLRPDIEQVRTNFLDPNNEESIVYVRFDLNTYWRNRYIKENLKEAYEFAKKVKKPLFILIGQDHFSDLDKFLKEEGYPVESFPIEYEFDEVMARNELKRAKEEL